MAFFEKRIKAHTLRRSGESIKDIAHRLGVAKSTVSIWCHDVVLTKSQERKLREKQIRAGNLGRMRGAEVNKQKRLENIRSQESHAKGMLGNLTERDRLMIGIGLYWGEGVKSGRSGASLVNSDPQCVLFVRDWFEGLGVSRLDFQPYIFISETHKRREQEIRTYWSNYLAIPLEQFHRVIFLKGRRKKVYENHNSYYGIVALRIRRSTTLKYKILGLIKGVTTMSG